MNKGLERRQFLKVLGAGGAGAALGGCGGGPEKLIPYVVPHEEIVPGLSTWYRTTCRECPAGCGMNVRTREGRAVKVEGNPLSPIAHGRLCARGQASLHGLYNPDRVPRALARRGSDWDRLTWDQAEQQLLEALGTHRGRTVFLTGSFTGTMDRLVDDFCAAFGIARVKYESFALEPVRAAHRLLFGTDAVPVHDFSQADYVLSFGADFMETWGSPVDYTHGWVQSHAYHGGRRGKLVWVGPHRTLTGLNADQWLAATPGSEHLVALAIARLVADESGAAAASLQLPPPAIVDQAASAAGVSRAELETIAHDFANGGRSLAVGPGVGASHAGATAVAAAVALLNSAAGNYGRTIRLDQREEALSGSAGYAALQQLVTRMANGEVGALLVHGPNPAYALPDAAAVAAALDRVPFLASFSPFLDETTERAQLLLPDHHFLEAWGDYVPRTGITKLVQPVMTPVFDTKQTGDVLLAVARRGNVALPDAAATFYDYLRGRWQRENLLAGFTGPSFDENWRQALQVGFVLDAAATTSPAASPVPNAAAMPALAPEPAPIGEPGGEDSFYLVVYPSYKLWDGNLANRPWLQELPDPVSKYSWSSWVEINPATAARLGIDNGHHVTVRTPHGEATLPAFPYPGVRPDTIAIQLGQGHTGYGPYARGRGVNALSLLAPAADPLSGALLHVQTRATIEHTGDWSRPVQTSARLDDAGREIARWASLEDARHADEARDLLFAAAGTAAAQEPAEGHGAEGGHGAEVHPNDAVVHSLQGAGGWAPATVDASPQGWPPPGTFYGEYSEEQPRWGMAIDLDRCIGCSACVVACMAENNIAVVGPDNVVKGRMLQWIRIERYWHNVEDPQQVAFLPMLCQHCSNAPCEPVCPVYAAYHTPDGLNAQVYNRCVGTRYCANNCPYKVRYLDYYTYEWPEPLNWQLNPDVTVREKGVMEKCTFCVQRIRDVQNQARLQGRGARDGEIVPACAQTCPADAIVFGNAKDPASRLRRVMESGRGYRVLEALNTQSAITYLKRVSLDAASESSGEH